MSEKNTGRTHAHSLGEIVWLLSQSKLHRGIQIGALESLIMPPILQKQFRIFYDDNQTPVGFATWAFVLEEVAAKIETRVTSQITPAVELREWKSGEVPFLIDFVCLFATKENRLTQKLIASLQRDIFKHHPVNGVRVNRKGASS